MYYATRSYGSIRGERCTLCDNDVTTNPHIIAQTNRTVVVGAIAIEVDQSMLVGIHEGAVPRCLYILPKGNRLIANNERLGTKIETAAEGKDTVFSHFDTTTRAKTTRTINKHCPTQVDASTVVMEISTLVGVETYFHQSHFQIIGAENQFARDVHKA